jgi:hypothetical protein
VVKKALVHHRGTETQRYTEKILQSGIEVAVGGILAGPVLSNRRRTKNLGPRIEVEQSDCSANV